MYEGSCLCGGVKYRIDGEIKSSSNCHCTMCQKQHGAAFASYGNVYLDALSYLCGQDLLAFFQSSPGVTRTFCMNCGSNLTWHSEHKHGNYIS
ncbi:MAG: GFA family protein, partial [Noviherbaspirillum sp.]